MAHYEGVKIYMDTILRNPSKHRKFLRATLKMCHQIYCNMELQEETKETLVGTV